MAQGKMRGRPNKPMPVGPFSQLITCAVSECGCQVIYDPKKKYNRTTGQEREYHYYHCTDGKGIHKRLGIPQVNVAEEKIWSQLETAVQGFSLTADVAEDLTNKINELNRDEAERSKRLYFETKEKAEALVRKQDQLYDDYTKQLIDEDDYRRMKVKTKEEIQNLNRKLENDYQSIQDLVRERLKFTLELAKNAESNWKKATPSDRVVLLKNVLSNFSLDGLNVRYNLKKQFALLSQIKTKATSEKWCTQVDEFRTALLGYAG